MLSENYETLMKETEDDVTAGKIHPVLGLEESVLLK